MSVFVIAEAASCHDGSLDKARQLVKVAKGCGADAVKFQTFNADRLAARRGAADYHAIYARYAMPFPWLGALKAEADALGIEFMTTAYDMETLPLIAPYVKRFKVASFEARDHAFLAAHKRDYPDRQLYVSAGMLTSREARDVGAYADVLLHCTSAYPAPVESLNLAVIPKLRELAGASVGYSDHSADVQTGALAVVLGAEVVEVHMRLATTDPGNADYAVSLPPLALAEYIRRLRWAERARGEPEKRVQEAEGPMLKYRVRS
jgi:sialic acid synthase SpsE